MHVAIIDFGSNTLRLSIYELTPERPYDFVQIVNRKTMAGLASYYDEDGSLKTEGIDKALEILKTYQQEIANFPDAQSHIFATAVLRKAKNARDIVDSIKQNCGLHLDVLSGEDEARYGFYGSKHLLKEDKGVQIDLGGGSTELVIFKNKEIEFAYSFDFGSLSLYLNFVSNLLPTPREMDDIRNYVQEELEKLPKELQKRSYDVLFGLGGSSRAAVKLRDSWTKNKKTCRENEVSNDELTRLLYEVSYDPHKAMHSILQTAPDRIHTLIPGIVCIQTIQNFFSAKTLSISKYGLREGYLLNKVLHL